MNAKRNNPRPLIWGLLILLLLLPVMVLVVKRMEGQPPDAVLALKAPFLGAEQSLTLDVADQKSGIRSVKVALFKDGQETVLLDKTFPAANILTGGAVRTQTIEVPINPKARGIKDGKGMLRLLVRDFSWRKWGDGNRQYQEHEVIIDTRPPDISVKTRTLNMAQGGSGLVVYTLSEDCPVSGVAVGDHFYPGEGGHFKDPLTRMAFIALDYRQSKNTPISVTATDFAGNQAKAGIPHLISPRRFIQDAINLSDRFLNWKMPEFRGLLQADAATPIIDLFLRVNRDLRRQNYEKLVEITAQSDKTLHWKGAFSRLRGAANRAGFADHRTYNYKGKVVDKQTHLGIDLAQ